MPPTVRRCLCLLALALLVLSCSQASVRHMKRQPWRINETQTLDMKFWSFRYESIALRDKLGLKGTAWPVMKILPPWATRIEELWIAAYLSDSLGRVLAKDVHVLLPRDLDQHNGIPFEFILEPQDIGSSEQLFVTFGYRMTLSDGKSGTSQAGNPNVFFANEGAVLQF